MGDAVDAVRAREARARQEAAAKDASIASQTERAIDELVALCGTYLGLLRQKGFPFGNVVVWRGQEVVALKLFYRGSLDEMWNGIQSLYLLSTGDIVYSAQSTFGPYKGEEPVLLSTWRERNREHFKHDFYLRDARHSVDRVRGKIERLRNM